MDPGELLAIVAEALKRLDVPFFVTGSTATIAYGEPRFTNDIDIVVELEAGDVDGLVAAFDEEDFSLSPESMASAIRRRSSFNLIHPSSGLKIDFMVAADSEFNESRFRRARPVETGIGEPVPFASPEDVILKKLEFFRDGGSEKHLRDIAGVLRVNDDLDCSYLDRWAVELAVEPEWLRAKELR